MIYEERDYRIKAGKPVEDGLLETQNSRSLAPVSCSPLQ